MRLADMNGTPARRLIAFGQVVGVHIDEWLIKDGLLDAAAMKPIMRAGYHDHFTATKDMRSPCPVLRAIGIEIPQRSVSCRT
jgi:hypothetical protein